MNHLDLFSGIFGFGLAFERAGFGCVGVSEVDAFACRALKHRRPSIPNLGDVTKIRGKTLGRVDVITGGFPCQDLSVAGKRRGLAGNRSGLFWEIVRLARETRAPWLVLENVPGLLSSNEGRDFGIVLDALEKLGYGVAWRVLDAQFFGVPQRRRRVFVVGCLGAPCPPEILFEPEGVPGDTEAGGEEGQRVAACLRVGAERASGVRSGIVEAQSENLVASIAGNAIGREPENGPQRGDVITDGTSHCLTAMDRHGVIAGLELGNQGSGGNVDRASPRSPFRTLDTNCPPGVVHALTAEGHDASEDGTGRGTPLVPTNTTGYQGDRVIGSANKWFSLPVQNCNNGGGAGALLLHETAVRRLTPLECERLQGFPDGWTNLPGASDSARYRALGNAVAVPVVEWIAQRLMRTMRSPKDSGAAPSSPPPFPAPESFGETRP